MGKWEYWDLLINKKDKTKAEILIGKIIKDLGGEEMLEHAQCGYYRKKRRGHVERGLNLWMPIAFWEEEGQVVMLAGKWKETDTYEVGKTFFRVRNDPVHYDAYLYALKYDQWADSIKEKPVEPVKKVDLSKTKPVF